MPKKAPVDYTGLAAAVRTRLLDGPAAGAEIYRAIGVSQSTFSRAVGRIRREILVAGRGSATRYALRRAIRGVEPRIPLFEIDEEGKAARFGALSPVHPRGFYLESDDEVRRPTRFFNDLPYFLDDLRPSGFLGRLIPRRHPELDAPRDVSKWAADDCLRYLTRFGSDLIGNIIVGEAAFSRYLETASREPDEIAAECRLAAYPERAREVLEFGDPGSSAGGEQPKFAAVAGPGRRPVLVKFSPKLTNEVAGRRADLLVCEHLALRAIAAAGHAAASSELVIGGDQIFLEVERFDRIPPKGRRGLISLLAIDAELVGSGRDWATSAGRLHEDGRIDAAARDEIRWRELFGRLIANTDMHQANLSFRFREPSILGVAPAYDMLPMLYAPQNEQLIERSFDPPTPRAQDADLWESACAAAGEFWDDVGADGRVSAPFRQVALENSRRVRALGRLRELLP